MNLLRNPRGSCEKIIVVASTVLIKSNSTPSTLIKSKKMQHMSILMRTTLRRSLREIGRLMGKSNHSRGSSRPILRRGCFLITSSLSKMWVILLKESMISTGSIISRRRPRRVRLSSDPTNSGQICSIATKLSWTTTKSRGRYFFIDSEVFSGDEVQGESPWEEMEGYQCQPQRSVRLLPTFPRIHRGPTQIGDQEGQKFW